MGWYYQIAVAYPELPGFTFMDRVHTCGGRLHEPAQDMCCAYASGVSAAAQPRRRETLCEYLCYLRRA